MSCFLATASHLLTSGVGHYKSSLCSGFSGSPPGAIPGELNYTGQSPRDGIWAAHQLTVHSLLHDTA